MHDLNSLFSKNMSCEVVNFIAELASIVESIYVAQTQHYFEHVKAEMACSQSLLKEPL